MSTARAKQQRMLDFATEVLGNREHQYLGRGINTALRPLRDEYLASLPVLAKDNWEIVQWHARRSDWGWCNTLLQILSALSDTSAVRRCLQHGSGPGCSSSGAQPGNPEPACNSSGAQTGKPGCSSSGGVPSSSGVQPDSSEASSSSGAQPGCSSSGPRSIQAAASATAEHIISLRASSYARIVISVASQYAWYMMMYTVCMPEGLAAVLVPEQTASRRAMRQVRESWENVQNLHRAAASQPACAKLYEDIYWAHSNVLVHEAMLICEQNEWNPEKMAVRKMVYDIWAGVADTKRVLEDVFGALKNVSTRNKNGHMSAHHAYFEASFAKVLHGQPQLAKPESGPGLRQLRSRECAPRNMLSQTVLPSDYAVPLCVPLKSMTEAMYRTSPDHPLPDALAADDILKKNPRVPWRPAGPAAIMRMVAASQYCQKEAASEWQHATHAWCGTLLCSGCVFVDQRDQSVFLSLGFQKWVALVVPLERVQCGDCTYFVLSGGLQQLAGGVSRPTAVVNHSVTDESHFRGVLVECLAPSQVPEQLCNRGIAWRQLEIMGLVPHAILMQLVMTVNILSGIARAFKICVSRRPGEKSLTKRAYVESIVAHFFPKESWQTTQEMVHHCMAGPAPMVSALDEATDLLDAENVRDFEVQAPAERNAPAPAENVPAEAAAAPAPAPAPAENVPAEAAAAPAPKPVDAASPEARRKAAAVNRHGPQQNFTPDAIKALVPGRCRIPGVYIVWRRTINQWEARYSGALPRASLSVTWDGRRQLTELEALCQVLDWLWLQHERSGAKSDSERAPSFENIMDAMTEMHHEWQLRAEATAAPAVAAEPPAEAAAAPAVAAEPPAEAAAAPAAVGRGRGCGRGAKAAAKTGGGRGSRGRGRKGGKGRGRAKVEAAPGSPPPPPPPPDDASSDSSTSSECEASAAVVAPGVAAAPGEGALTLDEELFGTHSD